MCALQVGHTSFPPPTVRSSSFTPSDNCEHSNNLLLADASRIYQERIRDPKRITPLEADAFPKLPSVTNILSVPSDTYYATKTLINSIKNKDGEEAQDALASLIAVPVNIGSSVGTLLDYGVGLHFLPHTLSFLLKPTYIFGLILCVIEEIIDSFGLSRQISFSQKFDFKLLKNLKTLTENTSAAEGQEAFISILSFVKENRTQVQDLYGKEDAKALLEFFDSLKKEIDQRPHFSKFIFEQHQPQIKELARVILAKNILHLQEEYLQLNPDEVNKVLKRVERKYGDLPIEKQREKLLSRLEKDLNTKRKTLARRVRPWMVHEASDTAPSILMGLTSHLAENRDLAVKEGLELMNDMRIQNVKKKIVHIIGIVALVIAAASLIALLAGAPYAVPLVLVSIATIVATGRFLAFSGSLDVRGWNFSWKNTLPDFIRKRLWNDLPLSDPEMLKKRKITPLTEIYDPPNSSVLW